MYFEFARINITQVFCANCTSNIT